MGMAAGQARLLSITSRMSDNELRAQVINNNKMRLATQSSQVSEAYVTALNEAQMMFTNYDANNMSSYQPLTYNALTAYNPYNNQYILTNSSGNVLLSETDAVNYRNANGNLENFLKAYGIERNTTYFSNLAQQYKEGQGIPYKTGIVDEKGMEELGYITVPNNANATAKEIAAHIQGLYEGMDDKLHPGYMDAVSSDDYFQYTKLLGEFSNKQDDFLGVIAQVMSEKLENLKSFGLSAGEKNLSEILSGLTDGELDKNLKMLKELQTLIFMASTYSWGKAGINIDNTNKSEEDIKEYEKAIADMKFFGDIQTQLQANSSDNISEKLTQDNFKFENKKVYTTDSKVYFEFDDSNNLTINWNAVDNSRNDTLSVTCKEDSEHPNEYMYDFTYDRVNYTLYVNKDYLNPTASFTEFELRMEHPNSAESVKSTCEQIISSLRSSIYSVWDPNRFKPSINELGNAEYTAYTSAGKDLSLKIFGFDVGEDYYANLDDIEWIKDVLDNGIDITNGENTKHYNCSDDKKNAFEKIYDAYLLDCIMNTYGEPKYTWIDKNNPNENGEIKAQWYENLFNRIKSGGYKVLQDGLASSNEWIQFAFESGIVTMEQVDANKNWQPLIYSNCSDITEQTNDAAVTKAEAEYKSAMNKIENKDKRYDLELKNIDTEHNSLQTEYESIKTAIDKNIERTFKLYS